MATTIKLETDENNITTMTETTDDGTTTYKQPVWTTTSIPSFLGSDDASFNSAFAQVNKAITILYDYINNLYPVGSVFLTTNTTDYSNFLGGTWDRLDGDYYLLTANENEDTGPSNGEPFKLVTHTHTVDTSHTHQPSNTDHTFYTGVDAIKATDFWASSKKSGDNTVHFTQMLQRNGSNNITRNAKTTKAGDTSKITSSPNLSDGVETISATATEYPKPPYYKVFAWQRQS